MHAVPSGIAFARQAAYGRSVTPTVRWLPGASRAQAAALRFSRVGPFGCRSPAVIGAISRRAIRSVPLAARTLVGSPCKNHPPSLPPRCSPQSPIAEYRCRSREPLRWSRYAQCCTTALRAVASSAHEVLAGEEPTAEAAASAVAVGGLRRHPRRSLQQHLLAYRTEGGERFGCPICSERAGGSGVVGRMGGLLAFSPCLAASFSAAIRA